MTEIRLARVCSTNFIDYTTTALHMESSHFLNSAATLYDDDDMAVIAKISQHNGCSGQQTIVTLICDLFSDLCTQSG